MEILVASKMVIKDSNPEMVIKDSNARIKDIFVNAEENIIKYLNGIIDEK